MIIDNLSWRDRAMRILEYHESQMQAHGIPISGIRGGWTVKDTAKELNLSSASIVQELKIARTLKTNPDNLASAKTRNQALDLITRGSNSLKVEIRNASIPMAGRIIKALQIDGYDFYYIKLDKPIITTHLTIETLILPMFQCRILRDYD